MGQHVVTRLNSLFPDPYDWDTINVPIASQRRTAIKQLFRQGWPVEEIARLSNAPWRVLMDALGVESVVVDLFVRSGWTFRDLAHFLDLPLATVARFVGGRTRGSKEAEAEESDGLEPLRKGRSFG